MNWLRIDDRFPDHPKAGALSDAAFRLWVTAACWSRAQATHGFVPRTQLRALTRHRTPNLLVRELTGSKVGSLHEVGLWEDTDGGWHFHDWDDYNPSGDDRQETPRSQSEAASLAGKKSALVRRERTGSAQPRSNGVRPNVPERNAERSTERTPNGPRTAFDRTSPNVSEPPDPDPDLAKVLKAAPKDLLGSAREPAKQQPQQPVGTLSDERISCPLNLVLTDDQRATLETSLIPGWAIDALTVRFVAKSVADPDDRRSLVAWRKSLGAAVAGNWGNPNTRPKRSTEEPRAESQSDVRTISDTAEGREAVIKMMGGR